MQQGRSVFPDLFLKRGFTVICPDFIINKTDNADFLKIIDDFIMAIQKQTHITLLFMFVSKYKSGWNGVIFARVKTAN